MTAPRTVAVPVEGGGQLVILCPAWCSGHTDIAMYPTDVAHESTEQDVTVTIPDGAVVDLLSVVLEHAPYSTTGSQRPYAAVRIGGDYHRFATPAALYAFADALVAEIAAKVPPVLRAAADQLAEILADFPEGSGS